MKFGAERTTPMVWDRNTVQCLAEFPHYSPPRPNQGLFSSQNKTGGLPLWYQIIRGFEKYIWWDADFLQGKWAKMGYLAKYCSVLPHFCCSDIFLLKCEWFILKWHKSGQWGWDMRELWWKIGFTPRAIWHFCRDWQHSSSRAISSPDQALALGYLWELSLIVASPGHRTQFTFQKYPCLGPQMTTSARGVYPGFSGN